MKKLTVRPKKMANPRVSILRVTKSAKVVDIIIRICMSTNRIVSPNRVKERRLT